MRKVYSNSTVAWTAGISLSPATKCFEIDASEQNIYIGNQANPLIVARLSTSGTISDAQIL